MQSALAGIRVVDLAERPAAAWCTRLLAAFGAEVVLVESPGGHPLRRLEPFARDGSSVIARYLHADKASIVADLDTTQGRAIVEPLIAVADVVVTSDLSSQHGALDLRWEAVARIRPDVVLLSVTPYGRSGRRAGVPGNDLTAYAASAWASVNGFADCEPIKGSGLCASYTAGVAAYSAVVLALCYRELSGAGQQVDVAEVETLGAMFGRGMLRAQYEADVPGRNTEMHLGGTFPVPVQDGFLSLSLGTGVRLRDALTVLGLHDLANDARWGDRRYRLSHQAEFTKAVLEALGNKAMRELFHDFSTMRVAAGPVLTMDELAADAHLHERGYWQRPSAEPSGALYPGAPFKMSETPWTLRHELPALGAQTGAVAGNLLGQELGSGDSGRRAAEALR